MATNNNSGSNKILVPEARQALDQMKLEIASELGMSNYNSMDKGNLPSRQNGYVGGYMTKRLVQMAQQSMGGGTPTR
ncbi:alpha/beta-type small acid-soluble spore protein [Clostridium sp. Cult1]|uniref:alpha/beta-type small acid-soluble spore protein n=1 Tax=Clostridium sp. Cult1 TaxID=2079002 RepID=UPI001F1C213D|nr:alpha/beta-type small acid-soluble spore protein [Clostridium sp. Cult1]MCF6463051.1 acid-soluble spore protein [Clostridium sp. Cult1]